MLCAWKGFFCPTIGSLTFSGVIGLYLTTLSHERNAQQPSGCEQVALDLWKQALRVVSAYRACDRCYTCHISSDMDKVELLSIMSSESDSKWHAGSIVQSWRIHELNNSENF